jgi:hypothetical protein
MSGVSTATVLAGASLAAAVGGTALSVAGQSQQAAAQAGAANYQAQVARNAQIVAGYNAANALKAGQIQEDQQRQKTGLMIGAQRAALAAQGGDITSGSAVDIIGDTGRAGEMDALTIRSNAARQSWGFQVAGANAGAQSGLYSTQAADTMANLPFGIGSSLLSGASSIANKWSAFPKSDPAGGVQVNSGGTSGTGPGTGYTY